MAKTRVLAEFWQFLREEKKYWLMPIVIVFVLFGLLVALLPLRGRGPAVVVSSPRTRSKQSESTREGRPLVTYDVELESAEPDGVAVTAPPFPGLLVLGTSLEEMSIS